MAILVELLKSRRGTTGPVSPRREIDLLVLGTDEDEGMHATVQAALEAEIGITYGGVNQILSFQNYDHEYIGGEVYEVTAHYALEEPKAKDDGSGPQYEYQFDTTGKTQRITQSLETLSRTAPTGLEAPDHGGAIGVVDGRAEGVDVPIPAFAWSETHYFPEAFVTEAYKIRLSNLTGKVNDATWRGYPRGSVMFMGARGAKRGKDQWQITFLFEYSENKDNIEVGDGSDMWSTVTIPEKEGWHYLWFQHETDNDTENVTLAKRLIGAYVERITEYSDFNILVP